MLQEKSNRIGIAEAVRDYIAKLPEPAHMPKEIELKIVFQKSIETHKIYLSGGDLGK